MSLPDASVVVLVDLSNDFVNMLLASHRFDEVLNTNEARTVHIKVVEGMMQPLLATYATASEHRRSIASTSHIYTYRRKWLRLSVAAMNSL